MNRNIEEVKKILKANEWLEEQEFGDSGKVPIMEIDINSAAILREKIADLVSIAHCGYHLKYLLKYQAVNLGDDLKVKRIYEITDQILPLIPNEEAIEERGYQRGVRDANKAVEMDAEEARRSIA